MVYANNEIESGPNSNRCPFSSLVYQTPLGDSSLFCKSHQEELQVTAMATTFALQRDLPGCNLMVPDLDAYNKALSFLGASLKLWYGVPAGILQGQLKSIEKLVPVRPQLASERQKPVDKHMLPTLILWAENAEMHFIQFLRRF